VEKGWGGPGGPNSTFDGSKVATTYWPDFTTRTGIAHNHTLSVSGGTDRMSAYASFGYLDQLGTSYGQGFKRYSTNGNITLKPMKWFEMGLRFNASWTEQEYGQDATGGGSSSMGNLYTSAMRLYPYAVPFDNDGNRIQFPGGDSQLRTVVDEEKYTQNQRQMLNLNVNAYAQIKLPLDGLSYRMEFGPGTRFRRNGVYVDPLSVIRESNMNYVGLYNERDFNWTVNNLVYYIKTFGLHSVNATLLQTASLDERLGDDILGRNTPVPDAKWHNLEAIDRANDITRVRSAYQKTTQTSYMARGLYTFNNRYSITATGRWDGSSVLATGNKWAFFPSVALAWRLDQESFIQDISAINALKLRLGWGIAGNAAVDPYSTITDLRTAIYSFGGTSTRFYYINDQYSNTTWTTLADRFLTWEKTAQYNLGIDFSLLKSRISGVIDAYTSRTSDLLLSASIPTLTGYTSTISNLGVTSNVGVDFTLNTLNVNTGGFRWETSFNVAWQKNKIVELASGKNDEVATNTTDSRFIGQALRVYYDYKYQGLWKAEDAELMAKYNSTKHPETGETKTAHNFKVGQIRPLDVNGDYVIDANNDRVIIGQRDPRWSGGINNTFSYKGIELQVQLYGRLGYITNGANVGMGARYMQRKVDYYNEKNTNAYYQRPERTSDGSDRDQFNTITAYMKADFINIRNISLGYVLPKKLINKWGDMQSMRVYFQIVNPGALYSACDFKNMDTNSPYWNRNFTFGLNVGF